MSVLLTENERTLQYCEVILEKENQEAVNSQDFQDYLMANFRERGYLLADRGSLVYRILQVEDHDGYLSILCQLTNIKSASPAFADKDTGDSRIVSKGENEGGACTCHLIIDINNPISSNMYFAIIEKMEGLPASRLAQLIQAVFRNRTNNRTRIKISPYAKYTFGDEIARGRIKNVEAEKVTSNGSEGELDTNIVDFEYQEISKLKFPVITGGNVIDQLALRFKGAHSKGYCTIKVTSEVNGKTKTSTYDLDKIDTMDSDDALKDDILMTPFSELESIELENPIEICCTNIHTELRNQMISRLRNIPRRQ